MKNIYLALGALFSCSCSFFFLENSVVIYDSPAFNDIKKDFWQDLKEHGKTNIMYAKGSKDSEFSDIPQGFGENMYNNLSLSFLYTEGDFSHQELSFKNYSMPNAKLTFTPHGFTLIQKNEKIETVLIGVTDWDLDGEKDFLLLSKITTTLPSSSKSIKKQHIQEHVLLIKDIEATPILSETILIREHEIENEKQTTEIYRDKRSIQGFILEEEAPLEYKQGEDNILFSPEQLEQDDHRPIQDTIKEKILTH